MTKPITITLDQELIDYIDDIAAINCRTRSAMIAWIIAKEKKFDEDLDEEAKEYESKNN